MTNEEMQKAMDFILNQQAQFAADIQKLQGSQAETARLLNRLAVATVKGFEDTNMRINALVDAQIRTDENLNKTNGDLRNLIAVVDRYFSEGRNGK